MRLKQTRLRPFYFGQRIVTKNTEGVPSSTFGTPISLQGELWPATSQRQIEQYGDRIQNVANMRVEGTYDIVMDGRVVSVVMNNGLTITPGDGVWVYAPTTEEPDYQVNSFTQYYPLRLEVERRG